MLLFINIILCWWLDHIETQFSWFFINSVHYQYSVYGTILLALNMRHWKAVSNVVVYQFDFMLMAWLYCNTICKILYTFCKLLHTVLLALNSWHWKAVSNAVVHDSCNLFVSHCIILGHQYGVHYTWYLSCCATIRLSAKARFILSMSLLLQ